MRQRKAVPLRKDGQYLVRVADQRTPFVPPGLERGPVAILQYEQGQVLVVFACQLYDGPARALPVDALYIQPVSQCRKRSQNTLDEGAMPAIEKLAGISRIFKARFQEKKSVLIHVVCPKAQGRCKEGDAQRKFASFGTAFQAKRSQRMYSLILIAKAQLFRSSP